LSNFITAIVQDSEAEQSKFNNEMIMIDKKDTNGFSSHSTDHYLKKNKIIDISSASNRSFKELKSLLNSRGIKHHERAIVSGSKVVSELVHMHPEIIEGWIMTSKGDTPTENFPLNITCYRIKSNLFNELDVYGTRYSLLLVKVSEFLIFPEHDIPVEAVLLVPFQDPANVGAVIRSAVAFGVKGIVVLKEAAHPFHPKSIRASGTQAFKVTFMKGPSIAELGDISRPIVALSSDGVDINNFVFPKRFALLPGVEGPGIPESVKPDYKVSIPMKPCVESLNATVATSIFLYEWYKFKNNS